MSKKFETWFKKNWHYIAAVTAGMTVTAFLVTYLTYVSKTSSSTDFFLSLYRPLKKSYTHQNVQNRYDFREMACQIESDVQGETREVSQGEGGDEFQSSRDLRVVRCVRHIQSNHFILLCHENIT